VTTQQSDDRPPAKEPDGINQLPELEEGDTVRVESVFNTHSTKTLTVEDVESSERYASPLYTLSGYGTEYEMALVESITGSWLDARMSWPTDRTRIANVEVLD